MKQTSSNNSNARTNNQTFLRQCTEFITILFFVFLVRTFVFGLYQVPTGSMETTMLVGERFFADKLSYLFRAPRRGEIVALIQPTYKFSSNPLYSFIERYVWGPQNWTKRVIGMPNELIEGKIEDGKPVIYINGKKLDEPYLNKSPLIVVKNARGEYIRKSFDPAHTYQDQPFYRINAEAVYKDILGNPHLIWPTQAKASSSLTAAALRGNRFWDGSDEFSIQLGPDEYWVMGDNRRGSQDSRYFGPVKQKNIFARITWLIFSIDSDDSWIIFDMLTHPIGFWSKIRTQRTLKQLV